MLQSGGGGSEDMVRTNYCTAPLPPKQPLASKDDDVSMKEDGRVKRSVLHSSKKKQTTRRTDYFQMLSALPKVDRPHFFL